MKGQSVNQMAATLGINRKRVYNGLERIKVNFRLVSHAHFHHFMTAGPRLAALADLRQLYASPSQPAAAASRTGENHSYYLKSFANCFDFNLQHSSVFFITSGRQALYQTPD
jgi:hypothetical protein